MKTHTSKKMILVKTILVIPLIAFLLFSFSTKEEVNKNVNPQTKTFSQDIATEKMVKEYNKLAKKFNALPKNERTISRKELGRMVYIFDRMTKEQREGSEEFPEVLLPQNAPAPPMPISGSDLGGIVPPPPPPPPLREHDAAAAPHLENGMVAPPPPPPNPTMHMKELSERGAVFFFEGKQITGKEAIEITKKIKAINIQVREQDSKKPIVKLSKDPIEID